MNYQLYQHPYHAYTTDMRRLSAIGFYDEHTDHSGCRCTSQTAMYQANGAFPPCLHAPTTAINQPLRNAATTYTLGNFAGELSRYCPLLFIKT